MKRIVYFLITNLAVMLVISVMVRLLGVDRFLTSNGLDLGMLLAFSALIGFTGSFISLMMSKSMAKWTTGAQVIAQPQTREEVWLMETVRKLADKAGISMPEVAVYQGDPNAFATGPNKNNSLVAVSTGLLQNMDHDEVEAVLAHEISHIVNGDMVTLTLIQGVVNTFVIFLSRVIAYFVDSAMRRDEDRSASPGMAYFLTSIACEILFGILASIVVMYFSRKREFRADAGAVKLLGNRQPMIDALTSLSQVQTGLLPKEIAASGIAGDGVMALFRSHPPLEARIEALRAL